ncbi:MAG: hypothetical protein K6A30_02430 [Lachnospiraceae bacterium]|nr:hypothetical protein [Lachnospiraceae bacterium]
MKKTTIQGAIAVAIILLATAGALYYRNKTLYTYTGYLDKEAMTIDGEEIELRELTYYFMMEEESVNETALEYNGKNPLEYWGLYINQAFVSVEARNTAVDYFVRDRIYSKLAKEAGLKLTKQEEEEINMAAEDFLDGMTKKQKALRMTDEDLLLALREHQLADDYVLYKAKKRGLTISEEVLSAYYGLNSKYFKEAKVEHKVELNKRVLEKVSLGRLSVN